MEINMPPSNGWRRSQGDLSRRGWHQLLRALPPRVPAADEPELRFGYWGSRDSRRRHGYQNLEGTGFACLRPTTCCAPQLCPVVPPDPVLRRPDFEGAMLRSGLVFNLGGGAPEAAAAAACSVQNPKSWLVSRCMSPSRPATSNPKHTLTYSWTSTGGKIEGKDTTATVDTNGVAGGSYTVTATVTDAKAKKKNTASCTANFTVKEPPKNPPQISCSANPTTVQAELRQPSPAPAPALTTFQSPSADGRHAAAAFPAAETPLP